VLGFTGTFRTPEQGAPAHAGLRLDVFTLGPATIASLRDVHVTAGTGLLRPRLSCGPAMRMWRSHL
jgi:hypothetical protein